jgi:PhnB protein
VALLNPYLNFKDKTREAMEFYKSVFGGDLTMTTFAEAQAPVGPDEGNNIMHAMLMAGPLVIMSSDVPAEMPFQPGNSINMSLSGDDEAELRGYWDKLSQGAQIIMPLDMAPWGDIFGMLTDKFGIPWLVNVNKQSAQGQS